jgi:hypothetical protein
MLALLAFSGCAHFGSSTIRADNFDYNKAIVDASNQQLLLNLVRMRYNDPWMFLEVSSVVSQYELRGAASASPRLVNGAGLTESGIGLGVDYAERPTVSYVPVQGGDFSRVMLTPIPAHVLIYLSGAGWEIKTLLMSCAESVNGLKNAHGGPTWMFAPDASGFKELLETLQVLQRAGAYSVRTETDESGKGKVLLVLNETQGPDAAKAQDRLRQLLGLDPSGTRFEIVGGLGDNRPDQIRMETRPLLGVYYFFAQAVEVPDQHVQESRVIVTKNPDGSRHDWSHVVGKLFKVRSSKSEPEDAFLKVKHRGYWFYIADDDPFSKQTYSLLNVMTLLQSGDSEGKSPLLTISAGP